MLDIPALCGHPGMCEELRVTVALNNAVATVENTPEVEFANSSILGYNIYVYTYICIHSTESVSELKLPGKETSNFLFKFEQHR